MYKMKTRNIILSTLLIAAVSITTAQEKTNEEMTTAQMERKIGSESIEKTYKIISNGKVVKNSVKINTTMGQPIAFKKEDDGKIDQDRVVPKKRITKTILIDSDEDDAYDEKIVFSYDSGSKEDFTLVSNEEEILIGLDEGENLNILESQSIDINSLNDGKEAYVFTHKNGKEIEFFIESYETLNDKSHMSKQ